MFGTPLYFMPGTQEQHGALLDRTCIHTRILIFHCNLCQAHQGTVALALHLIKHTHTHTHTSTHLLAPLCNLCQAHQGTVVLALPFIKHTHIHTFWYPSAICAKHTRATWRLRCNLSNIHTRTRTHTHIHTHPHTRTHTPFGTPLQSVPSTPGRRGACASLGLPAK
jgi:hypothetical protein